MWKLKNKQLQHQLDEISNGDFSKRLKNNEISIVSSKIDPNVKYRVYFGDSPDFLANRFSVVFREDELESVPEYNPNDWNEYPKVTPSENIPMRVETESGGYIYRECAIFNEGVWKCERDGNADEEIYGHVKRFRPWED